MDMKKQIQFIAISPEEVNKPVNERLERIEGMFELFQKEFQPKRREEYVSISEAAKRLGVDKSTLYNWKKRNIVKFFQIGHRVYLKWSQVEESMEPLS